MTQKLQHIDILKIMELIPHRYPFLLVDKIIDIIPGEQGTGIKNVTINEPFFQGHFPERPVMPGVLVVEAMAQIGTCIGALKYPKVLEENFALFMGINNAKFRQVINPGDQLHIKIVKTKERTNMWEFHGEAFINDKLATEADIRAMLAPKKM